MADEQVQVTINVRTEGWPKPERCGATTVFWPDVEARDAECIRLRGHGGTVHEDAIMGEWDEETFGVPTRYPEADRD